MSNRPFSPSGGIPETPEASPKINITSSDEDEVIAKELPKAWSGPYSDTAFTVREEDGAWILKIRIDAETPIDLQSPHLTLDLVEEHARIMDFGLGVARDANNFSNETISENVLALAYCRDFYKQNGQMLHSSIAKSRATMDVSADNIQAIESGTRSAAAMCRISERIASAMARAMTPEEIARVDRWPSFSKH